MKPQVIRTDTGFAVLVNGKQIPIPVGFMRVSEVTRFEKMLEEITDEVLRSSASR